MGWVANATPRPLYPPGKIPYPLYRRLGGPPGPVWTGAENLAPTGIRSPDRPSHSESQYRLRYAGPSSWGTIRFSRTPVHRFGWRTYKRMSRKPRSGVWNKRTFHNFEAITNLMHKYLYACNITILYMFRALLCSSSGGSIVYVQHLVLSLSVSGCTATHRQWQYQMLYIYNWTSWRWA